MSTRDLGKKTAKKATFFWKLTLENSLENKKCSIFQVIIEDFNVSTIWGHFQSLAFLSVATQKHADSSHLMLSPALP